MRVEDSGTDGEEALFDLLMGGNEDVSGTGTESGKELPVASPDELSSLQRRLWFLHQLDPSGTAYIIPVHMRLRGRLDRPALEKALKQLWTHHEALRTVFVSEEGIPHRKLLGSNEFRLLSHDFNGRGEDWRQHYRDHYSGPIMLDKGPLFRAVLYTLAPEDHALLLDLHHINGDGFSVGILCDELFAAYSAFSRGNPPETPRTDASCNRFVAWEHSRKADAEKNLAERIRELGDAPTQIDFLFDKPLPTKFTGEGGIVFADRNDFSFFRLAAERGTAEGITAFSVYLAAFGAMLHAHSGQEDILVGVPISVRPDESYAQAVGFFVNTCVARLDFSGDPTLRELLRRTNAAVRRMLSRPNVPLDGLVNALRSKRRADRPQIVQAVFSFMEESGRTPHAPEGLCVERILPERRDAMFELTLDLLLDGDKGGYCGLEYYSGAWEEPGAEGMLRHFLLAIRAIAQNPDQRLSEIDFAAEETADSPALEGRRIEDSFLCVPDLIRGQALAAPQRAALIYGGLSVSRAQLDLLVALRRSQLVALGLKPGDVLGLLCAPGLEWTATALAAMSQCFVVAPLDTDAPHERLRTILERSGAVLLWHDGSFVPEKGESPLPCRTADSRDAPEVSPTDDPCLCHPLATAYIIHTSGTTGFPKGVRVSHGAFAAHCRSAALAYGLTQADRELAFAPSHFDAFWEQLFAPLTVGASVHMRDADLWAPGELCRRLNRFSVTVADLPPQYLRELLFHLRDNPGEAPKSLRLLLSGGEAMPSSLAREWLEGPLGDRPLVNAYGPTEAVVTSVINRIDRTTRIETENGIVPIGVAMPGRVLRILLPNGRETGTGMAGDLWIGGPCLAEGYHRDAERTGEVFRHWHRTPEGGAFCEASVEGALRLYRSGDRVRLGPDGRIEFLGRADRQIKLRGHRIEPGEVETVLAHHPAVAQALATVVEDPVIGEQLVAYVLPREGAAPATGELSAWMTRFLPGHMVPSAIVMVDRFPTTATGKIDLSSLPRPRLEPPTSAAHAAPADETEKRVCAVWAELLGRSDFGTGDNFFDLGGHSILLVRLHSRLTSELGARVRLVDLFANPTVAKMAALLRGEAGDPVRRAKRTRRGNIAVVGMAGRFPAADDIDAFWRNLAEGKECIRFFTEEEQNKAGVPEKLRRTPGYVPAHGYMEGSRLFDASFFGYTPREAALIDPQQRVFLEECWHALENAGYDPDRFAGDIGVYGGCGMSLYLLRNLAPLLEGGNDAEAYAASLSADKDFITARVSYKLNLRGPSVNVNTACSTSLVAIHLAADALLADECDMVLAGGCTLHFPEKSGYVHQKGGIASPDGHCRAFADDATGTVGGSGCGIVVLKKLDRALADGDTIHAVLKASAVNNDGADKIGFTAPGPARQRDVIRAALDAAGVGAGDLQYVEAHGTGTPLGDPVEIKALCEAWAPDKPKPQGCLLGSVKSSIGHLDTAAGAAGFIKTVLALEHALIPPTLHCETPNRRIGFADTPFRIARKAEPWPEGVRRRAAVSAFGMGGTNAHVVLEEAPSSNAPAPRQDLWCLPLSARSAKSLLALAAKLADRIESDARFDALDAWFTLGEGRRRQAFRVVALADSRTGAVASLRNLGMQDLLATDRDGRALSGTGLPQAGRFDASPDFTNALAYAGAWLTGTQADASAALPKVPHRRIPLPGTVFDHEEFWIAGSPSAPEPAATPPDTPRKLDPSLWLHFPAWERLASVRPVPEDDAEDILIVHNGGSGQSALLDALRAARLHFIAALSGEGLEATLAWSAHNGPLPRTVWHFCELDTGPGANPAGRLPALLADVRTLAKSYGTAPLRLVLFRPHKGGADFPADPASSFVDAVTAVLPHEYPGIQTSSAQIDPGDRSLTALRLLRAATLHGRDGAILAANGRLWRGVHSPMPASAPASGTRRLKEGGVYLVTGGLGGIGLTLAAYLAKEFHARLVLVGRHEPDAPERRTIADMEAAGGLVRTAAFDVADAAAMTALVDDVTRCWGRIDGVIHAAGVAGGSLVARTGVEEIERVFRPKVAGTLALDEALRGRSPDFVFLCSSLTVALGGPGQVAYAAANAWMDDFAASRAATEPGVWTSARWDAWASVGMAARASSGAVPVTGAELWAQTVSPQSFWPWGEHRIGGRAVLPGTGYLDLFAKAVGLPMALDTATIVEPLTGGNETLRLRILRDGAGLSLLFEGSGTTLNASARIAQSLPPASFENVEAVRARCKPIEPPASPSTETDAIVIDAGPRWKLAGKYWTGKDEALAELSLAPQFAADLAEHPLHPALLDVALSFGILLAKNATGMLPWRYEKVLAYVPLEARVFSHARLRSANERSLVLDVDVSSFDGRPLLRVEGYTLVRASERTKPAPAPANPFAIEPAEGTRVFLQALASAESVVEVSTVDWRYAESLSAPSPADAAGEEKSAAPRKPRPELATPFTEPRTRAEKLLAQVWAGILGYDRLGADDDLFDLGADSLTALQASARLRNLGGGDLAMDRFFEKATVRHLADGIPDPVTPEAKEGWEEGEI